MEELGMIRTMIDDGDDSTFEVAISRPAMDMISGLPGISESDFVDRFADDIEEIVERMLLLDNRDEEGRILVTGAWAADLWPCRGGVTRPDLDAFGHAN